MEIEDILAKGADAAVEQVGKAVSKVTGSPAEEFGELVRDHVRFRRAKNLVRFYVKYQRIVEEAGIDQRELPFRMWFPIFENASIEEDDDLQVKWAALLANAANPDSDVSVGPAFIETLKQLSPLEAKLLDVLYDDSTGVLQWTPEDAATQIGAGSGDAAVMLEHLSHLGTCEPSTHLSRSPSLGRVLTMEAEGPTVRTGSHYERTLFGSAFVAACRTPSAESSQDKK